MDAKILVRIQKGNHKDNNKSKNRDKNLTNINSFNRNNSGISQLLHSSNRLMTILI